MKIKNQIILLAALLSVASTIGLHAQGAAFTYQGRLNANGSPANGKYDFRFRLASDPLGNNYVGSSLLTNGISVTNGLFTTVLDFGPGIFTGSNYWLEVDVRTNNGGSYATLNPLQALTPTPYAITAGHVTGGGIATGTYGNAVTFSNSANSFSGSGAGLTSLNASELTSGTVPEAALGNAWKVGGNSGTSPTNGDFLGTVDSQPLELRVNGQRVLRLESDTNGYGAPNVIGGAPNNFVDPGIIGATIAGGGVLNYTTNGYEPGPGSNHVSAVWGTISGGRRNTVAADHATIAGGHDNVIKAFAYDSAIGGGSGNINGSPYATLGGGGYNSIGTNSNSGTVSGGFANQIADNTHDSTIGGGSYGGIGINSFASTIGGGSHNSVGDNASVAAIGGGTNNTASAFGTTVGGGANNTASGPGATVAGGAGNTAAGYYSFAAGLHALALHDGSFVWADDTGTTFSSTAANQFLIRAGGGVGINTPAPGADLEVVTTNANGNEIRFGYYTGGSGNLIAGPSYVGIATEDLVTRLAIRQGNGDIGIGTLNPDALLSVNGTADKPGGGSWNTFSDRRLKDVGGNFTNGLAALESIQPVHYHYKADNPLKLPSQPEYVGVVAQQVQKAVPEAVERSQNGYLVVNNDPIIWTMVNAIKELKAENDALQLRVKRLEREAALRSNQKPN